jgi:hypothetical protein
MIQGVFTKKCTWCGEHGVIQVEEVELYAYLRGTPAKDAFKSLAPELREQYITGTHPECWEQYKDDDSDYDRMREETWLK